MESQASKMKLAVVQLRQFFVTISLLEMESHNQLSAHINYMIRFFCEGNCANVISFREIKLVTQTGGLDFHFFQFSERVSYILSLKTVRADLEAISGRRQDGDIGII